MIGNLDETLHRGLEPFRGTLPAHVSAGLHDGVAATIQRVERAHRFFIDQLGVEPRIAVLILATDDWAGRSNHPLYGMPNYRDGNLVLAGEPNPFWTGLVGPRSQRDTRRRTTATTLLPRAGLRRGSEPLLRPSRRARAGPHLHRSRRAVPSRLWVLELACNVLLHAYVAVEEPQNLPTLETFPSVFAAIAASQFTHRTLDDFERSYAHCMDGVNCGWFQVKLHVAAESIFDSGGMQASARVWDLLADEPSSRNLTDTLEHHLGPAAMHLLRELGGPAGSAR